MTPPRTIIESPLAGDASNRDYALACLRDSLRRGEAPLASHLLYPQVLDDAVPDERALGMVAGFAWLTVAQRSAVYLDRGVSEGMAEGVRRAVAAGLTVEFRAFGSWGEARRLCGIASALCVVDPASARRLRAAMGVA